MKRILLKTVCYLAALALSVSPVFVLAEETISQSNNQVGPQEPVGVQEPVGPQEPVGHQDILPDSIIEANSENVDQTIDSTINSDTNIENNAKIIADTGNNQIGASTVVQSIQTGDIVGVGTIINTAGTVLDPDSTLRIKTVDGDNLIDQSDFVSMDSFNIGNPLSQVDPSSFVQINNTNIEDNLSIDLNTGLNEILNNTLIDSFQTGSIDFILNMINILNLTDPNLDLDIDIYSILNNFSGDIYVDDSQGSSNSEEPIFRALDQNYSNTTEANYNLTTGENEFSDNTKIGSIETGNALAGQFGRSLDGLFLNTQLLILNVLGDWEGADLSNTGITQVNLLPTLADIVDGESNTDVTRNVSYNANTGKNRVANNTAIGSVSTGGIRIISNFVDLLSTLRSTNGKFKITIINILGCFKGNVVSVKKDECGQACPQEEQDEIVLPDSPVPNNEIQGSSGEVLSDAVFASLPITTAEINQTSAIQPLANTDVEVGTDLAPAVLISILSALLISALLRKKTGSA